MTNTVGTQSETDGFNALMRHPYGTLLWSVIDRPLELFSTLLESEFADDPAMCRLAAAEMGRITNEMWEGKEHLLPNEILEWVHRSRQHYYNCGCASAVCGLFLDTRANWLITTLAIAVRSSINWLGDEALARRYVLAGIGVGMFSAAVATNDKTISWVPPHIKDWARDQYDSYLP